MTKSELEAKLSRLRSELDTIMAGHGAYNLLRQYAKDMGTGYKAFERAKDTIERLIAQAEKDLAGLPKPSKFELAKQEFYDEWGSTATEMGPLGAYVDMLETCRPWVIKSKSTGSFAIHSVTRKIVLFATKEDASEYNERTGSSGWEVVQWEGGE